MKHTQNSSPRLPVLGAAMALLILPSVAQAQYGVGDRHYGVGGADVIIEEADPEAGDGTMAALQTGVQAYNQRCRFCHGDPTTNDPPPNATIKVPGARACSITRSIYGNRRAGEDTPYPNGVPAMQWLKGLVDVVTSRAIADYLNSFPVSGRKRYITACSGCHGIDGSGGFSGEDVRGEAETREAINDEDAMLFLRCLPRRDIRQIDNHLGNLDDGDSDSG